MKHIGQAIPSRFPKPQLLSSASSPPFAQPMSTTRASRFDTTPAMSSAVSRKRRESQSEPPPPAEVLLSSYVRKGGVITIVGRLICCSIGIGEAARPAPDNIIRIGKDVPGR